MNRQIVGLFAVVLCCACGEPEPPQEAGDPGADLDDVTRRYLYLELSMGRHDGNHVDAYFGPDEIRAAAEREALTLEEIQAQARSLAGILRNWPADASEPLAAERIEGMIYRLGALVYLSLLGKQGIVELAELTVSKAAEVR